MLIKVKQNINDLRDDSLCDDYYFSFFDEGEELKISGTVVTTNLYLDHKDLDEIPDNLYTEIKFASGYLPSMDVLEVIGAEEDEPSVINGDVYVDEEGYTYIGDLSLLTEYSTKTEYDKILNSYIRHKLNLIEVISQLRDDLHSLRGLLEKDWIENYLQFFLYDYKAATKQVKYSHCVFLKSLGLLKDTDEVMSARLLMERYNPEKSFTRISNSEYNTLMTHTDEPIPWEELCKPYQIKKKPKSTQGQGFGGN